MKTIMGNREVLSALLLFFFATVALSQVKEITGFNIPDYDEKNNLKSQLSGDKARFESDDRIVISNLKIESFKDDAVEMTVTAPTCIYDRRQKTARSKSPIRIERENMVITGADFEYNSEKDVFKINKDVKVVLANRDIDIESGDSE